MGRRIDRIVFLSLLAGALYVFFVGAFHSIPLSAAAAFFAMALLKKLAPPAPRNPLRERRQARGRAKAELERLAMSDAEDAKERLRELFEDAFPGQTPSLTMEFVLRHPAGAALSADELFERWKAHRGAETMLLVSLPEPSEPCRALATRLRAPRARVVGGDELADLVRRHGWDAPRSESPLPPEKGRVRARIRAACRARAGRHSLTALGFLGLYWITGAVAHLMGAVLFLFLVGIGLHRRRAPQTLFDSV